MSLKNFFDSRTTTHRPRSEKPPSVRFILRRERDRTRFILFYCITGLILIFGQTAFSEEICATSFAEMKTMPSVTIPKIAAQLEKSKGFTNKTNRSHIKFNNPDGTNGRMIVSYYSTHDKDGSFEFVEGTLKVCEDDGKITIDSLPTGRRDLYFFEANNCFKVSGGLATLASNDQKTFCLGDMPSTVQLAMEAKAKNDRALAGNSAVSNNAGDVLSGSDSAANGTSVKGVVR